MSWAPSCGRSYHLVATGSRDGHVRIWKIRPGSEDLDNEAALMGDGDGEESKWTASLVADFEQHRLDDSFLLVYRLINHSFLRSAVGRVEWNVTGYMSKLSPLLCPLTHTFYKELYFRQQVTTVAFVYGKLHRAASGDQPGV